jgi:hypothetical protein
MNEALGVCVDAILQVALPGAESVDQAVHETIIGD